MLAKIFRMPQKRWCLSGVVRQSKVMIFIDSSPPAGLTMDYKGLAETLGPLFLARHRIPLLEGVVFGLSGRSG